MAIGWTFGCGILCVNAATASARASFASFTFAIIISVMAAAKPAIELAKRWISDELFMLAIYIQHDPKPFLIAAQVPWQARQITLENLKSGSVKLFSIKMKNDGI
jgi:hypothetical protein